jgi:hypothetical protein
MKKPYPHFDRKNPSSNEEKLIAELVKDLDDVTTGFMKLNCPGIITQEIFVVLRDAAIAYAGHMLVDLRKILISKEQHKLFDEEAVGIFKSYLGGKNGTRK